jgi:hypothetical protein
MQPFAVVFKGSIRNGTILWPKRDVIAGSIPAFDDVIAEMSEIAIRDYAGMNRVDRIT